MKSWHNTEPPENVLLDVKGTNYGGDWCGEAMKRTYKIKPEWMKREWRWVNKCGSRYDNQRIDFWRRK